MSAEEEYELHMAKSLNVMYEHLVESLTEQLKAQTETIRKLNILYKRRQDYVKD